MKTGKAIVVGLAVCLAMVGVAFAAVIFDSTNGTGFVGKGDVQDAFGWNNAQLQANADAVEFRASGEVVTEVSWICTNSNNEHTQERARTTTSAFAGVVDSVTRDKKQVVGFTLQGYIAGSTATSTTDGPSLNSCPNANGSWTLTTEAGEPVEISSSVTLQVSINGSDWVNLITQ